MVVMLVIISYQVQEGVIHVHHWPIHWEVQQLLVQNVMDVQPVHHQQVNAHHVKLVIIYQTTNV